ncbi:hypothetical protein VP01_1943g4 [Puccinia sorghi]|uniref:Uncharacterized protein n=1 Tax=Puccinia sorghi TaxID=27349 RepID=A0A0L6VE48_9BASI|nr:hypothetical protein VP01_1943g4 [Puccinia sorghi]
MSGSGMTSTGKEFLDDDRLLLLSDAESGVLSRWDGHHCDPHHLHIQTHKILPQSIKCSILQFNLETFKFLASKLAELDEIPVSTRLWPQVNRPKIISNTAAKRVFHHIILLLFKLALTYIKIAKPGITHSEIYNNLKFNPFFNKGLGETTPRRWSDS